jgi:aconitate hydratase
MKSKISQKLISAHLISGEMIPGTEIGLKLIKYYFKMPLARWSCWLEAFQLKKPNRK